MIYANPGPYPEPLKITALRLINRLITVPRAIPGEESGNFSCQKIDSNRTPPFSKGDVYSHRCMAIHFNVRLKIPAIFSLFWRRQTNFMPENSRIISALIA
jgi:hypothetical protein